MRAIRIVLRSLSVLREHWKVLLLVTACGELVRTVPVDLGLSPPVLVFLAALGGLPTGLSLLAIGSMVFLLAQLVLYVFVHGVCTSYVVGREEAGSGDLADAVRNCRVRLKKCVAAFSISGLIVLCIAFVATTLAFHVLQVGHFSIERGPELDRSIARFVLVVFQMPTLYVALGFLLVVPIAVVEDGGILDSIARAWRMMNVRRLYSLLVLAPPAFLGVAAISASEKFFLGMMGRSHAFDPFWRGCWWSTSTLLSAGVEAWCLVAVALLYLELRARPALHARTGRMVRAVKA